MVMLQQYRRGAPIVTARWKCCAGAAGLRAERHNLGFSLWSRRASGMCARLTRDVDARGGRGVFPARASAKIKMGTRSASPHRGKRRMTASSPPWS